MGSSPPTKRMVGLCTGFFVCMCLHELALESLTLQWPHRVGAGSYALLPQLVTMSQTAGCVLLPAVLSGQACQLFRRVPVTPSAVAPYAALTACILLSTTFSTAAVQHVDYVVKVASKACKLVPVMLISTAVNGKRYSLREYLAAMLFCGGAAGYSIQPRHETSAAEVDTDAKPAWGLILLALALLGDALVPNMQQRAMSSGIGGSKPVSPQELMVITNLYAFVAVGVWMACDRMQQYVTIVDGIQVPSPALLSDDSQSHLVLLIIIVGACVAAALQFSMDIINEYGSVVAVSVATARKIVTMLLSYLIFPKPVSALQVAALVCIVAGTALAAWASILKGTMAGKPNRGLTLPK
jgi:adenosine 3'-phospho 5'-phosphosulfate transporter B3